MLLGRLDKQAIWWVAGIAVAGCLVLGWIFGLESSDDRSNKFLDGLTDLVEIEPQAVGDPNLGVHVSETEDSKLKELMSLVDLLEACQESSEALSEECMQALDTRFLQKPLTDVLLHWIEFPNALTYASIFKDPVGDRERVFAVLGRPECRLEEGMGVRVDLKESCDAAAIARFSKFLAVCRMGGEPTTLDHFFHAYRFLFVDPERSKSQNSLEAENSRELARKNLILSRLESDWKSKKCKMQFDSSLLLNPTRDAQPIARLLEMSRRFGIGPTSAPSDEYRWNWTLIRALESLANRLGAEETLSSTYVPFSRNANAEWDQFVEKTRPWLEPWEKLMRFPDRRDSTLLGIDLVLGLQNVGATFDWNYLVDMICSRKTEETSTCQEVFDEIEQSTDWFEVRKLQVLDEFETRALELGLYD